MYFNYQSTKFRYNSSYITLGRPWYSVSTYNCAGCAVSLLLMEDCLALFTNVLLVQGGLCHRGCYHVAWRGG